GTALSNLAAALGIEGRLIEDHAGVIAFLQFGNFVIATNDCDYLYIVRARRFIASELRLNATGQISIKRFRFSFLFCLSNGAGLLQFLKREIEVLKKLF